MQQVGLFRKIKMIKLRIIRNIQKVFHIGKMIDVCTYYIKRLIASIILRLNKEDRFKVIYAVRHVVF